jgi:hypothetical protein
MKKVIVVLALLAAPLFMANVYPPESELPTLYAERLLTNAQMVACYSTPLPVVSGEPGILLLPLRVIWAKTTGAYTLGSMSFAQIQWNGTGGALAKSAAGSGTFGSASAVNVLSIGPGNGGTSMYGDLADITAQAGLPLTAGCAGGNPSGANGGTVLVRLWYQRIPL